ncbi:MAG: acyltransferase [Bacteroidota bacterium]
MKLSYKSFWYKSTSVLRYVLLRMWYRNRFHCPGWSMIGQNCGIHIFPKGHIHCDERIIVDDHVMLFAKGRLKLGKRFCINRYSRIVAHESIEIGDHVTIGQMVSILDHDHRYLMQQDALRLDGYRTAPIRIGSNVWIGDKCTILKGVTIGDNVVVGAHTLVHKDVPSGVVVAGQPFKVLKELTSQKQPS